MGRRRLPALAAVIAALMLPACNLDGEGDAADATTTSTESTMVAAFQTCAAEADGYRVEHPRDWHTNEADETEPCRFFHPDPFEATPATETTDVAIVLRFTSAPFEAIVSETVESPAGAVIVDDERTAVGGMDAARIRTRATGDGLVPEGTLGVLWFVDFGTRTMTATTLSVADDVTFERSVEVLDHMMRTMERVESSDALPTCSAADLSPEPVEQPGLPEPVRGMRDRIVRAAVACDFQALEALALVTGGEFTYSFGAEGDPGGYWRREEEGQGPAPLRFLVGVLNRPYQRVQHAHRDEVRYVWPSAFGYDSWDAVPPEDKESLRPLYTEDDFESFARFGGYVGYRVGMTPEGEWEFFVAGD